MKRPILEVRSRYHPAQWVDASSFACPFPSLAPFTEGKEFAHRFTFADDDVYVVEARLITFSLYGLITRRHPVYLTLTSRGRFTFYETRDVGDVEGAAFYAYITDHRDEGNASHEDSHR